MKYLTRGLGAVKLIKYCGMNFEPGPEEGGPLAISQEEGASIDVMGTDVFSRALIIEGKGSRISPEKENPVDWWLMGKEGKKERRNGDKDKPNIESTT